MCNRPIYKHVKHVRRFIVSLIAKAHIGDIQGFETLRQCFYGEIITDYAVLAIAVESIARYVVLSVGVQIFNNNNWIVCLSEDERTTADVRRLFE